LRILLDHNLDRRLKNYLPKHDVSTTQEQGWADVLNGELLTLLEANGFDVMLTADANIKSQQNMVNRKISILVLRAFNNRLATHLEMLEQIEKALSEIQIGEIVEVYHPELLGKLG
jgi:predicted nuclease of predicted toxin-antitoxin system